MAPRKTGGKDREENSPRSTAVQKNLSLRGEGRPLSLAAASAPNYGGEDGGRPANSLHVSEKMAPMKTGANDRDKKSPRSRAVRKTSP